MSDFVSFARAHGLEIDPGKLYPSEKIRRCPTVDSPRSKNGAYMWDGERGFVFNWSEEAKAQWFEDPTARRWTEEEKKAWARKRFEGKARQEDAYRQAARRAQVLMDSSSKSTHAYLHIKGFSEQIGLVLPTHQVWDAEARDHRTVENVLLVPMRSLTGELMGVQEIWWEDALRKYVKQMMPGMRARGAVLRLGDKEAPETCLVEGYSTGLSVLAAMRSVGIRASVLVCFSAHNMEVVAPLMRGKVYLFADNDRHKTSQGEKSAKATGLPYCVSDVDGYDANDVHQKQGLMKVCQLIMQARRA